MCCLPADAELAARADIRSCLAPLTTNTAADITTAAARGVSTTVFPFLTCPRPTVCRRLPCPPSATCSNIRSTPRPFTLLTTSASISVNMCTRTVAGPGLQKDNCPNPSSAQANMDNAVATSWFKMSKWYTTGSGITTANAGANFGVVPQPCQVSENTQTSSFQRPSS
jgi:hypothetical protein